MSRLLARTGRQADELRPVTIETGMAGYAEGSALIALGRTRVWCTASVEERVPPWLLGGKRGWVTAEYAMLPRATNQRTSRERATNSGRSQEISRLIGRSLRAGIDLRALGERQIIVDCDVLEADGGTRTAAITGGFVALALACEALKRTNVVKSSPISGSIAAISAGIVAGDVRVDLDYREDAAADVDCNIVTNARGDLIEVQGTAEGRAYTREQLNAMLDVALPAITMLQDMQAQAIRAALA